MNDNKLDPSSQFYIKYSRDAGIIHVQDENFVESINLQIFLLKSVKCDHNEIDIYIQSDFYVDEINLIDYI